ncbi:MAG: WD40 repeat domain-containing protein, partial [Pseudonocardiaceae bacterium]
RAHPGDRQVRPHHATLGRPRPPQTPPADHPPRPHQRSQRSGLSPDGHILATASFDTTAQLWDVREPRQPQLITTLRGHISLVTSVAFSGDGRTLATVSHDNTARLWDISDPRQPTPLVTLTGHTDDVDGVAFSGDRRTLATGSFDRTARLWETNVENVADRICRVTPTITTSEWDQYLSSLPYQPPCPRAARSAGPR